MLRLLIALVSTAAVLPAGAAAISEAFATDPVARGWRVFGDTSLFHWNSTNRNMRVTWDSSRTNSFFYLPLGTVLTKADDFGAAFEIRLDDIRLGATLGKTNEFQIAIGFLGYHSATNAKFFRGAGVHPEYGVRNLVEFDYFPDAGFGDTFATTAVSTNNRIYPVHNVPVTMTTGDTFRITLTYAASNQVLTTRATRNGSPFGQDPDNRLQDLSMAGKADFRVDSFAIISYSDAIQTGPINFHGSILAHGSVDNVELVVPPPPITGLRLSRSALVWNAEFGSRTSWIYSLERCTNLINWVTVAVSSNGIGGSLTLSDTNVPLNHAFYRVQAQRP